MVIVKPGVSVPTKDAYSAVTPAIPKIKLETLITMPMKHWLGNVKNDFEASVFPGYPDIQRIKEVLLSKGAVYASMSGSTHEMAVVEEICTHVAILDHGRVMEAGTVESVFSNPRTEAGRRLVYPDGVHISELPAASVIRIAFNGGSSYEPLIASLAIDCGVKVNILGADTRNVNGQAFGTMLLGLPEDPAEAAKAVSYIKNQPNVTMEEVRDYHV